MNIYRGRQAHLPDDNEDSDAGGLDEEPIVIVQLAARVQDATRCRTGSLDMCIQGKCQVNIYYILECYFISLYTVSGLACM